MEAKLQEILNKIQGQSTTRDISQIERELDNIFYGPQQTIFAPLLSQIYKSLGKSYFQSKASKEAIDAYQNAIKMNPNDIQNCKTCYHELGLIYSSMDQFEQAVECYQKLSLIIPNNHSIMFNIALGMNNLKKFKESISYYKAALLLNPSSISTILNLGSIYFKIRDYDNAIQMYIKALKIDSNEARAYFNLGITYNKLKNYNNAILYFSKVISLGLLQDPIKAYINLAENYIMIGEIDKAFCIYQEVSSRNPQKEQIYKNFSSLFLNNNQEELGMKILIEGTKNNKSFIKSVKDTTIKVQLIKQLRKTEMLRLKLELKSLTQNKLFTSLFRREINNEIVEFFAKTE